MSSQKRNEDGSRVIYSHERSEEYAEIEVVGQYLLAEEYIKRELFPYRQEISTLVDFGCGAGKSIRAAAPTVRLGGRLIGLDISEEMLQQAELITEAKRDLYPNQAFQFRKIEIDGNEETFPLMDREADVVITSIVLQEIQSMELLRSVFREISRITRTNGVFVGACVSDKIVNEDFTSFTYAGFDENRRNHEVGSNFRKCRSVVSSIVWESDRHWRSVDFRDILLDSGYSDIQIYYPRASADILPFPLEPERRWKDELHTAPLMMVRAIRF